MDESAHEEVEALIGVSAGKICYTNYDEASHYRDLIVDTAEIVWENCLSAWTFYALWIDGTTIWHNPEETIIAFVDAKGSIRFEEF
jgi:hypothetical protein